MARNQAETIRTTYDMETEEKSKAEFWNVVLFEGLGTGLLVYGALASNGASYGISLVYFICLVMFGRISGGHFNPVVTLIMYIEGQLTAKKGLTYIVPQFTASFVAAMVALPILNLERGPYIEKYPADQAFATFVAELMGSSLFFLFVCVQMNKKTEVSPSPIISAVFISAIFFIAREFTITMENSLFNPAAAVGLSVFYGAYYGEWDQWVNIFSYMAGPWLGGILAQTFYHKVYLKTLEEKQK